MSEYAKAWSFKHPSPWDYMFFMNNALKQRPRLVLVLLAVHDRDRWTARSQSVTTTGGTTTVTVRQDGQMPSPVVLKVQFAPYGRGEANGEQCDGWFECGDRDPAEGSGPSAGS